MVTDDDFDLDVARSSLRLGDRWFPACALVCPDGGFGDRRADRLLGGDAIWFVPCESGLLIELAAQDLGPLAVTLYARSCSLVEGRMWLPQMLYACDGVIHPSSPPDTAGAWRIGAEPEWIAGLIDRLSGYAYEQPAGPEVELVSVAEAQVLVNDWPQWRDVAG